MECKPRADTSCDWKDDQTGRDYEWLRMKDFQIKRGGFNDLQATVQPRAGEGVLSLGEGQISATARRPQENRQKWMM